MIQVMTRIALLLLPLLLQPPPLVTAASTAEVTAIEPPRLGGGGPGGGNGAARVVRRPCWRARGPAMVGEELLHHHHFMKSGGTSVSAVLEGLYNPGSSAGGEEAWEDDGTPPRDQVMPGSRKSGCFAASPGPKEQATRMETHERRHRGRKPPETRTARARRRPAPAGATQGDEMEVGFDLLRDCRVAFGHSGTASFVKTLRKGVVPGLSNMRGRTFRHAMCHDQRGSEQRAGGELGEGGRQDDLIRRIPNVFLNDVDNTEPGGAGTDPRASIVCHMLGWTRSPLSWCLSGWGELTCLAKLAINGCHAGHRCSDRVTGKGSLPSVPCGTPDAMCPVNMTRFQRFRNERKCKSGPQQAGCLQEAGQKQEAIGVDPSRLASCDDPLEQASEPTHL